LLFKTALGYFKGVVVCLSCTVFGFFWCYLTFLKGWSGLFCLWLPGNPGCHCSWFAAKSSRFFYY